LILAISFDKTFKELQKEKLSRFKQKLKIAFRYFVFLFSNVFFILFVCSYVSENDGKS